MESVLEPRLRAHPCQPATTGGVRWPQCLCAGSGRGGGAPLLRYRPRPLAGTIMNTSLETRVDEIATRLAFQERTLTELSDALAQARLDTERTHRLTSHPPTEPKR